MRFYAVIAVLLVGLSVLPWMYHDYNQNKKYDEALISSAQELTRVNAELDEIKKDKDPYLPEAFRSELKDFFDRMDKFFKDLDKIFDGDNKETSQP